MGQAARARIAPARLPGLEPERAWRDYETSLHLTEDECNRLGFMRPKGPPAEPRPSHYDLLASFQRMCAQANWDAAAEFNKFIEDGRVAAEAAKGREQALSVLRIPPAKPRTRTAAPTPAQTPAEAPTGA